MSCWAVFRPIHRWAKSTHSRPASPHARCPRASAETTAHKGSFRRSRLHPATKNALQARLWRSIRERMRRPGAPDQIKSLRYVLRELLDLHFPSLSLSHVVPTSFSHRKCEAEIVNSQQGRTAWLQITEEDLYRALEGDCTAMHDSLARFFQSVGFSK